MATPPSSPPAPSEGHQLGEDFSGPYRYTASGSAAAGAADGKYQATVTSRLTSKTAPAVPCAFSYLCQGSALVELPVRLSRQHLCRSKMKTRFRVDAQFMKLHQILYFDYSLPAPAKALLLVVLSATRFSSARNPNSLPKSNLRSRPRFQRSWLARTSLASPRVVEDGRFEWAAGFGMLTWKTMFRPLNILSTGWRPFPNHSRNAAMQLFGAGNSIWTHPFRILPIVSQKPWPITTRQVMGHLAGIRHYKSGCKTIRSRQCKHFEKQIEVG